MHRRFFAVMFSAALFVVATPLAAGAQEGTAEETTARANDAASAGAETTTGSVSMVVESTTPESTTPESTNINPPSELNTAQNSDIPAGTPAPGTNPDNPSSPPNVITIGVEGCTVSEGASITVEDGDGTEARFVDGSRAIVITGTRDEITIEGPPGDFIGDHAVSTSDPGFDTDGDYTVVTSSGITCNDEGGGGGGNNDNNRNNNDNNRNDNDHNNRGVARGAADHQYRGNLGIGDLGLGDNPGFGTGQDTNIPEDVIADTIPNRKLPFTGGPPLFGFAVIGLACACLGVAVLRGALRRAQDRK
jgi:hypothetical protein